MGTDPVSLEPLPAAFLLGPHCPNHRRPALPAPPSLQRRHLPHHRMTRPRPARHSGFQQGRPWVSSRAVPGPRLLSEQGSCLGPVLALSLLCVVTWTDDRMPRVCFSIGKMKGGRCLPFGLLQGLNKFTRVRCSRDPGGDHCALPALHPRRGSRRLHLGGNHAGVFPGRRVN